MQISSGDWDARVRPGWEVNVVCFVQKNWEGQWWCAGSECESSGAESDEEGQDRDEHGGAGVEKRKCCGSCVVNSRREWWFAR
jgi:hypothetical protein